METGFEAAAWVKVDLPDFHSTNEINESINSATCEARAPADIVNSRLADDEVRDFHPRLSST